MTSDPAFWAIIAGAAMMTFGVSPLLNHDIPSGKPLERGCILFVLGLAVVLIALAVKALR